jgi:purine-binding chemotaxis protein CheW
MAEALSTQTARLNLLLKRLRQLESAVRGTDSRQSPSSESSWLVTLRIGDGRYALPLHQTREVVRFARLTSVPAAPRFVLGVLNLRGEALPVVDPLILWDREGLTPGRESAIVFVEACSRVYGILVDRVEDVVSNAMADAPEDGAEEEAAATVLSPCVMSTRRDKAGLFQVLDPARLVAPALITELDEALTRALEAVKDVPSYRPGSDT